MQHLFQGATVFKLCQHGCAPPPPQEANPSACWQTSAQSDARLAAVQTSIKETVGISGLHGNIFMNPVNEPVQAAAA